MIATTNTITKVPNNSVAELLNDFMLVGAAAIAVADEEGTFTVTAAAINLDSPV